MNRQFDVTDEQVAQAVNQQALFFLQDVERGDTLTLKGPTRTSIVKVLEVRDQPLKIAVVVPVVWTT